MKSILSLSICVLLAMPFSTAIAGGTKQKQENTETKSVANVNKLDGKKRRTGNWEFYWDEDTKLVSSEGRFKKGKQVGTWKYYNQEGKLERVEKNKWYSHKIKTEQYYPNGQLQKEGYARVRVSKEYVDYFWTGDWKCYDESGKFVKIEKYKEGELVAE